MKHPSAYQVFLFTDMCIEFDCICIIGLDIKDMYPFGPSQGDIDAPKNDDDSVEVDLTFSFPYFDTAETTLYVRT